MPLTNLGKQRIFEGLLGLIQTGGGTAYLRVVDTVPEPEETVLEFALTIPELTISNGLAYFPANLIATAQKTVTVENCICRVVNRAGTSLGYFFMNYTKLDFGQGLMPSGFVDFVSGYDYQLSQITLEINA